MREWSNEQRRQGRRIGFVPTMGYLHEGHLSLMRASRERCDVLVVSIYVNPTQFAPNEDLDRYPRDYARDHTLCEQEGVDVIFYPDDAEIYKTNHKTYVITEDLANRLCGTSRPTHFRGVTTIVCKLFNIVQPQVAVFGQKDAQQAIILQRMVEDLNFDIEIIVSPIVRESDGLAMSSRNKFLNEDERRQALVLCRSLKLAEAEFAAGRRDIAQVLEKMRRLIAGEALARIDYIEAVDAQTLSEVQSSSEKILIALAVFFGRTRLIDNIILSAG